MGDLHRLPLPGDHVDVMVCALALTHMAAPPAEFTRVLGPGGNPVTFDAHPELVALGSMPQLGRGDGRPGLLPGHRVGARLRPPWPRGSWRAGARRR